MNIPHSRAASFSSLLLLLLSTAVPAHSQPLPTFAPVNVQPLSFEDAYTLGSGDIIEVELFQVPEYSGPTQVLVDGTVNLPLAGVVSVYGLTLSEAADAISAQYAAYYRRPIVTLSLLSARPVRFSVSGEVSTAGSYTVDLEGSDADITSARLPTLTSAIQTAGGVTASADLREVQISRPFRTDSGIVTTEVITVNLWDLIKDGQLIHDVTLRDGDSIFIPATDYIDLLEIRQLAQVNLYAVTERPIDVAVVGEVKRPGSHTLIVNRTSEADGTIPTVTRAIQVAGGITETANVRHIEVRRQTAEGDLQVFPVDLWKLLQEGDINQDTVIQNGDTIFIPEATELDPAIATELATATFSPDEIPVYVVGEVENPGLIQVPPNTPLNQAILAAGGFDNIRADRGEVTLIRLNPDGTVEEREIPIDFASGLSTSENPPLRSNDVILVGRSGITSFSDTLSSIVAPIGNIFPIVNLLRLLGL